MHTSGLSLCSRGVSFKGAFASPSAGHGRSVSHASSLMPGIAFCVPSCLGMPSAVCWEQCGALSSHMCVHTPWHARTHNPCTYEHGPGRVGDAHAHTKHTGFIAWREKQAHQPGDSSSSSSSSKKARGLVSDHTAKQKPTFPSTRSLSLSFQRELHSA